MTNKTIAAMNVLGTLRLLAREGAIKDLTIERLSVNATDDRQTARALADHIAGELGSTAREAVDPDGNEHFAIETNGPIELLQIGWS